MARARAELAAAPPTAQLVVHYQPIVDLGDRRVAGVEALVRWQHPTRGLLPPASSSRSPSGPALIAGIGQFVLRQACAELAGWRTGPAALTCRVNVSPRSCTTRASLDGCARCLAGTACAPHQLVLEITESMLLADEST